jgi:hypothetical protein
LLYCELEIARLEDRLKVSLLYEAPVMEVSDEASRSFANRGLIRALVYCTQIFKWAFQFKYDFLCDGVDHQLGLIGILEASTAI